MKTDKELRVLSAIQSDLLKELVKERDTILKQFKMDVDRASFSASKYKERECYDELIKIKRAYNILKTFLELTHDEK